MKKIFQNQLKEKLPGYRFRPEQLSMAEAVDNVLKNCGHLVVEAPTGTGKTFAYLIPALKSGLKVVVSTGTKNLQEQLFFKDLPLLKRVLGVDFSACYMKGRSNYLCYKRFLQATRQGFLPGTYQARLSSRIEKWLEKTESGDRSELEFLPDKSPLWMEICSKSDLCDNQKCPHFSQCFITKMKKRAYKSDLIVVNHHLFFADLALKSSEYGQVIPEFDAVVFDEAHQLEDTVTSYFGTTISNYRLRELVNDCLREAQKNLKLEKAAGKLGKGVEAFFKKFSTYPGRGKLTEIRKGKEIRETAGILLDDLELLGATILAASDISEELRSCARRAVELRESLNRIMTEEDPAYVYWYETRNNGVFLNISPIDVSETLKEHLYQETQRLVMTSATLAVDNDFNYFVKRLGLVEPILLGLPHSFDYSSQAILYIPPKIPEPSHPDFSAKAADEICRILEQTQGRAFVLFTSLRSLDTIHALLQNRLDYLLLKQGEMAKAALLEKFRENEHSVLFGAASFWGGVDVRGTALSCVIVEKLPFASPGDPLTQARIDYIRQQQGNPFMEYQVPTAVLNLKQGLGRLIRSHHDRGALSILDIRLYTKRYGHIFFKSLPSCRITRRVEDVGAFLSTPDN